MNRVKVTRLGGDVFKDSFPEGTTVQDVVEASGLLEDGLCIRKNNQKTDPNDLIENNDLITLVPQVRGGK